MTPEAFYAMYPPIHKRKYTQLDDFKGDILTATAKIQEFVNIMKPVSVLVSTLEHYLDHDRAVDVASEAGAALHRVGGALDVELTPIHILAMHSALINHVSEKTSREAIAAFVKAKES